MMIGTPLHIVCKHRTIDIIKYFVDLNVNLNCKTNDGLRPIHIVCKYRTFDIIKYIVDLGVDLNCKSNDGLRPQNYASKYNTNETVLYIYFKIPSNYFKKLFN